MTPGQMLYELRHPRLIRVVLFARRHFARLEDSFLVANPVHHPRWELLTAEARESYEREAATHNLTQGMKAAP